MFADYPLDPAPEATNVLAGADVLTFSLGGLSKSAGLPQLKLGWIGFGGPSAKVDEALAAYEIDRRHLSVGVDAGAGCRGGSDRERRRDSRADPGAGSPRISNRCASSPTAHPSVNVLRVEGGWSAVVAGAAAARAKRRWSSSCSSKDDVLVHPGYFFDFDREAFVVVSLLVEPATFDRGGRRACWRARPERTS